jgi:hypothetical protein
MDKLDLLAKYLVKASASKDHKNMVKSANFLRSIWGSIKARPVTWGLGTVGTLGTIGGGIALGRSLYGGKEEGRGKGNEPPPPISDDEFKKLLDEISSKNKNTELGGEVAGMGGNLTPYDMGGGGRGKSDKGFLGTIGSLVDPVISLTGRDPESVPNISKLLLLAGLVTGMASLFNRGSGWLPWTAGGLTLAGLGSSLLLGSRPDQQQQQQQMLPQTYPQVF